MTIERRKEAYNKDAFKVVCESCETDRDEPRVLYYNPNGDGDVWEGRHLIYILELYRSRA
jgi:hypothetical protein